MCVYECAFVCVCVCMYVSIRVCVCVVLAQSPTTNATCSELSKRSPLQLYM